MKSDIKQDRHGVVGFTCGNTASDAPDWREQLKKWNDLLEKCSQKPSSKRVHGLRTATLRIKAQLEYWFGDEPAECISSLRSARRWIKNADKLRKALSPVRDADVYLDMLRGMRGPTAGEAKQISRASRDCLREVNKFERKLKRNRDAAERKLATVLKKCSESWVQASSALQTSLTSTDTLPRKDVATRVREMVAGLASDAPGLTAETLHAFRKRSKAARYLAEILAPHDARARRAASLLKKIQGSAGQWHDWQSLAAKGKKLFGEHEELDLLRILDAIAERSFEEALRVCHQAASELVELEKPNVSAERRGAMKRPTRRAIPPDIADQALSA